MKAELIINNVKLELGHKELNEISYALDGCERAKDIYHELAQSPSAETRLNIVLQNCLHAKTIRLLLSDTKIEVMRSMINKNQFISQMEKNDIERFIDSGDSEILTDIVRHIDDFAEVYEVCEKDWLCEKLYQQPDPSVRYALAENSETPEFFLKKLLKDADINVSRTAQETLSDIEEEDFDNDDDEVSI